jgi:hypothetical protein
VHHKQNTTGNYVTTLLEYSCMCVTVCSNQPWRTIKQSEGVLIWLRERQMVPGFGNGALAQFKRQWHELTAALTSFLHALDLILAWLPVRHARTCKSTPAHACDHTVLGTCSSSLSSRTARDS